MYRLVLSVAACAAVALLAADQLGAAHAEEHAHDHHGHEHGHAEHTDHSKTMYSKEANDGEAPADPDTGHEHDHHEHDHDHSDCGHDHGHDHGHTAADPTASFAGVPHIIWLKAIGSTLLISVAPILMLAFIPIDTNNPDHQSFLKVMLAFAAGGLLGDAFLHLIPHAINPHSHGGDDDGGHGHSHGHDHDHGTDDHAGHDHTKGLVVGLWILAGIISFLMIEMFVRSVKGGDGHGHGHSHGAPKPVAAAAPATEGRVTRSSAKKAVAKEEKTSDAKDDGSMLPQEIAVTGYLNLAADFAHNFTDGLAIGASWLSGSETQAYVMVLVILLHEVPHEIGDFAILLQSGCTKWQAMKLQFSTAIGAMAGTIVGLMAQNLAESTQWVLPFTAGGFIYIATVSVIPALLEDTTLWQSVKELLAMAVGIGIMVIIVFIE